MGKRLFGMEFSSATTAGRQRRRRVSAWGIFALAAVLVLVSTAFFQKAAGKNQVGAERQLTAAPGGANPGLPQSAHVGKLLPLSETPPGAQQVSVGLYINRVYELDAIANTYYLSGYVWLRWRGDFDPVASLEFPNAVDEWGLTKTLVNETPVALPDGSQYQSLHIEGRFFQPFDLHNYPIDQQELALYVEDNAHPIDQVVYLPDQPSTGYDESLVIPGWRVLGVNENVYTHDYGTDFGETGVPRASEYATAKFALELRRSRSMFIGRLMLPLLIVLLTNWLALRIKPTLIDARMALPATALLTTVFLQQACLDAIPQVTSLVLMDKIYIVAYILIIFTFIQIIWSNSRINEEDSASIARISKTDHWSFWGQLAVFITALVIFLATLS